MSDLRRGCQLEECVGSANQKELLCVVYPRLDGPEGLSGGMIMDLEDVL